MFEKQNLLLQEFSFKFVFTGGAGSSSPAGALVWLRQTGTLAAELRLLMLWLPVAEHRLQGMRASVAVAPRLLKQELPVAGAHGLSCCVICGVFSHQGLGLCLLNWVVSAFTAEPPGRLSRNS